MGDVASEWLWIRPGSGFWSDNEPKTLLTKANVVANASAHVSGQVKVPQGWRVAYSSNHMSQFPVGASVHEMMNPSFFTPHDLQLAGLPVTAFEEHATGHFLHGAGTNTY